jgi:hypothetical protein
MDVILALCYKSIGQINEAVAIMEGKLADSTTHPGLIDHLHLGVMLLELGDFQSAIKHLEQQEMIDDLAENRFYKAIAFKFISDTVAYMENLKLSKEMYLNGNSLFDPYVEMIEKIYLSDILAEEKNGFQQQLPAGEGFVLRRVGK